MQYRRFGRTQIQMPVFSCGGMRYQFKWQDVPASQIPRNNQKNLEATICRAIEVGINHIETARGYGTSEYQLGRILPSLPREELIVQTKINPSDNTREFQQKFEQSLKNLRLDYVDLLAIHGINDAESLQQSVRPGGCVEVVQKLQAQGKVRFLGFSTHGPTDIIVQAIATDLFDYVNLHWYYINQNNWAAIAAATRHDMGVFIISPSDKGGKLYQPPQKLVDLCNPLSPIVFNNLFCLSHSQVHTLSVGAARPQDFDEHLKTLALLDRSDDVLPPILARLEQAAIASLGESWAKTWHVGLPKHSETPGDVNIPVILWLRNLAIAYDMVDYAKMRYNLLGSGGSWFPGANAANINQLDLQYCLRNSPHAEKIPAILQEAHQLLGDAAIQRLSKQ
ncbi:aldo/keto reductase [Gloeocapsa sp. PCC 7428]|uniref:aldo/keto reductase n=1 Tax=Gloeocapsa sp. PCC 7428 TaxID=1173026 RepID=UPI0005A55311|nr:aldo/keto reductase [Gloeocapsa sp. PCC 7428]